MDSYKTNAIMVNAEDIEQYLSEWGKVPTWIKIHVSIKYPLHRYEGQLILQDDILVFRGQDMKEGRNYHLEIPMEVIKEVQMGFSEDKDSRIAFDFGTAGFEPFGVLYQLNGENYTVYFYTCPDNYQPHMNFNTRKWYQMLEEMINGNGASRLVRTKQRVLVGV
jgi:hypothetical protein